jgi:hypothetical protein
VYAGLGLAPAACAWPPCSYSVSSLGGQLLRFISAISAMYGYAERQILFSLGPPSAAGGDWKVGVVLTAITSGMKANDTSIQQPWLLYPQNQVSVCSVRLRRDD